MPIPDRARALAVPQTAHPPQIDGLLTDDAWKTAAIATDFWISEQQRRPTEQTEVLVTTDQRALYFAFRVYDRLPGQIEALQTRNDAGLGLDDQVVVELDPYLSHREISSYGVNAMGTRTDAIAGGRARQQSWKGEWRAAAKRTPYGWSAEIAIPFSILNFEPGTTSFGVNFLRYHNRTSEWSRWADVTVQNLPEKMGRLIGLRTAGNANPRPWTFLPYAIAGRNVPDKRGETRSSLLTGGADIRYEPTQNLTGVLSLNPDFSQVENAITDINFNYTEKFRADNRPFFQEGAAYFGKTPAYFYSNRIPGFDYGAKLFSRSAGYQLGALATRAPGQRTDAVLRLEREFDPTRSIAGMFVGSDRPGARGLNGIVSGKGREPSGLTYGFDGSLTRAQGYAGDGSFIQGAAGWQRDFWSTGLSANRYSADYAPVNALLASDLPGTRGIAAYSSYYRDLGDGPLRELTGSVVWHGRETGDGRLQRNYLYAGGSVELRREVKVSLSGTGGQYRAGVPFAAGAPESSRWSAVINRDLYWTLGLDLNTRNSRYAYGTAVSSGRVGGSDYRYGYAYAWVRPTPTTVLNLSAEQIRQFERNNQYVATWGWDVTPSQGLYVRYIRSTENQYRLAYRFQITEWIDFFAVVDRQVDHDTQVSAKVLMTLP